MSRVASRTAIALAAFAVAACSDSPAPVAPPLISADQSPKMVISSDPAQIIPGRFIVTVASNVSPAAVAAEYGVSPQFVYTRALNGFAGSISEIARSGLLRDSRVTRIETDGIARAMTTQSGATWGLDRSDQRNLPLSTTYTYTATGAGVKAYIIDTGILFSHSEFGARAITGYDAIDGGTADDCNGHGTHVAGTVGGTNYGIAKGVTLVAVRVLDCAGSGAWSQVIAGMDWATADHAAGAPAVANLSLGGSSNVSVDDAARRMIADGIATGIAAGNGFFGFAQNACNYSPARVAEGMTIGATDKTDKKASFSNYGNCVDFFAPGVGITSAWYTSTTATNTINGTSMATPHVVGVAAQYLQNNTSATPQQVRDALYAATTKGKVTSANSVNNHLLFTSY